MSVLGIEMGAGSCTGDGLIRLLSYKAPVDFDWRKSVWLGMVLNPKLIFLKQWIEVWHHTYAASGLILHEIIR